MVAGRYRFARRCLLVAGLSVLLPAPAVLHAQRRQLAPGVLHTIPGEPQVDETRTGPMTSVEITARKELDWKPPFTSKSRTVFERAQRVTLRRSIWNFEFAFKPLRLMQVDVPQASGKMQRKTVWYLVYRVRYLGGEIAPKPGPDGSATPLVAENPEGRYFFPQFLLTAHEVHKTYFDQVIPAAIQPIAEREKPDGPLHDSVTISQQPVPLSKGRLSEGVWGVATWVDIDPRIDFLSLDIKGLTNAYQAVDPPGAYKAGDPPGTGRQLLSKTLRLHFWKPGDTVTEEEDEIRFGIPVEEDPARQQAVLKAYGARRRLDYEWIYR